MKTEIVVVGDTGVDHYLNQNLKKPGGIAFNFATHAMSSDTNVSLVSAIGSDIFGRKLKNVLKKCAIDITHIKHMHGKTAKQKIILEQTGERRFAGYTPGVLRYWTLDKKDLTFIAKHDAIFVPLSDGMEHIFHAIKDLKTDGLKCVDFSQDSEFADFDKEENIVTKYCQYFDINFIGASEKEKEMVRRLAQKYPEKLFVLTLGARGSIGFLGHEEFVQAAKNISIVDTTGCGDAFQAKFLVTYLQTHNVKVALDVATAHAASVAGNVGSTKYIL